ncbi:hypothetical protein [Flagellimonas sp.]|jgi:hypothetical protein|uniref:hypothetical protein n=1 Tax=Flagellimonas sp. TaxID=2058762 RepID=UPI003BAD72BB|tara:strand:- start:150 stop:488 length:339 start_codon:yes stop_codon:yes gene_type:complete
MITNLHKRILISASLLMAVAMLAPSIIKLGHALYEHNQEEQCIAYGTNHIHDGHLDCDFHDFTLANKVLFNSSFTYLPVEIPEIRYTTSIYQFIYKPKEVAFRALRGPPSVS